MAKGKVIAASAAGAKMPKNRGARGQKANTTENNSEKGEKYAQGWVETPFWAIAHNLLQD
jgi:hypothetical protein